MSDDITYMWNLNKCTNELTYRTDSYRCRKQSYDYQGEREEGRNWAIGTDVDTLLCIKKSECSSLSRV